MGIAIIIVGGLVIVSIVASVFGFLEKKKGRDDTALEERIKLLEARVNTIYESSQERDDKVNKLEADLRFLNRLIEDKPKESK
jgi:chaperonin cofactor prefoldin